MISIRVTLEEGEKGGPRGEGSVPAGSPQVDAAQGVSSLGCQVGDIAGLADVACNPLHSMQPELSTPHPVLQTSLPWCKLLFQGCNSSCVSEQG